MISSPTALPEQPVTPLPRAATVVIGRQDYFSVLLRLIGMELYKLRRRAMSKVLPILTLLLTFFVFVLIALFLLLIVTSSPSSLAPQTCTQTSNGQTVCTPSQNSEAQLQQVKQKQVTSVSSIVRLPTVEYVVSMYLIPNILPLLAIIMAGAICGGEYGQGTIRLLFTRGPTRIQYLLAKLGALLAWIIPSVLIVSIFGILLGQLVNLISGVPQTGDFFSAAWLGHSLLMQMVLMLNIFVYAMIAVFFGTLGRSTAFGVVAGLIWLFLEPVLSGIISLVASISQGSAQAILKAVPDYLIGNNTSALVQNQVGALASTQRPSTSISDVHALLVLAVYLVIFIGSSILLTVRRDVTN